MFVALPHKRVHYSFIVHLRFRQKVVYTLADPAVVLGGGGNLDGVPTKGTPKQTCAKVPKRSEILGSLSPRSGTLMDLGLCTSLLSWDSGNPGPQSFSSRKPLETQDLKIWICGKTLETQSPEPQDFDIFRLEVHLELEVQCRNISIFALTCF